jgi:hypothetical protein
MDWFGMQLLQIVWVQSFEFYSSKIGNRETKKHVREGKKRPIPNATMETIGAMTGSPSVQPLPWIHCRQKFLITMF